MSATSNFIEITGKVLRPKIYEYKATDKFKDLIVFAQGVDKGADEKRISLNYEKNGALLSKNVKLEETIGNNIASRLDIGSFTVNSNVGVEVIGDSVSSGFYPYVKSSTLSGLIEKLKFHENIYPFLFILSQYDSTGMIKEKYYLSLLDYKSNDIILKHNVKLEFFTFEEMLVVSEISKELFMNRKEIKDSRSKQLSNFNENITALELDKAVIASLSDKDFNSKNIEKYRELQTKIPDRFTKLVMNNEKIFFMPITGKFTHLVHCCTLAFPVINL